MLVNVTPRKTGQRLNVKFTKSEHDQIAKRANIVGRLRLAVRYEPKEKLIILTPSTAHDSNVLTPSAGNWDYIVSYDGFQKRTGNNLVASRDIEQSLNILESGEFKISIADLIIEEPERSSGEIKRIRDAIATINRAVDEGLKISLEDGRISARL